MKFNLRLTLMCSDVKEWFCILEQSKGVKSALEKGSSLLLTLVIFVSKKYEGRILNNNYGTRI